MLINAVIEEKQVGHKTLLRSTELKLQEGEVVGFVGRNGVGKTTLTKILTGADKDFLGSVDRKSELIILSTEQEQHASDETVSTLDYVLDGLRDYRSLTSMLEDYAETMGEDMDKITAYTEAVEKYDSMGYYYVKDRVIESLKAYQLTETQINGPISSLSGGQKRFAQLVQVEYSNADLLILDEPTNHMDYIAKASFVEWLKHTESAVLVISHDRDVLAAVDRIIELKDCRLTSFPGDYEAFLRQNTVSSTSAMHQYEVDVKTLANRQAALKSAIVKKNQSASSPNPFMPLVRRLEKEVAMLEERMEKPTIWIDQESAGELKRGQGDQYAKYKAKTINLRDAKHGSVGKASQLVSVDKLVLGYGKPLFSPISFSMRAGERWQVVGRNGAGKTTFVDAFCATAMHQPLEAEIFGGVIDPAPSLKVGRYEQEINPRFLTMQLGEAIADIYRDAGRPVNEEVIFQTLSEYLFERHDLNMPVMQLSGGQKARLQLIALFASRPNLLILDEPTNHLDLPSIEELENALKRYDGALLYISHDSFFAKALGGEIITIGA